MDSEAEIRGVIAKIDAAWRAKEFSGLESCFHRDAQIVGPEYVRYAVGRDKCADSYREFATNADVLAYDERAHDLYVWDSIAIYTFHWRMTYQRSSGPKEEQGTDQLVLQKNQEGWQVVWRHIFFKATNDAA